MSKRMKPSRYNHFVPLENGHWLVFNALSCGLAELDEDTYQKLLGLGNGKSPEAIDAELLTNFKKGNFLIPDGMDELDLIRANHYMARFGNRGFGLTIIPTHRCNFACDYCYERSELHRAKPTNQTDMSDSVCDNIVTLCEQRIPEKSAFSVTWYGGEPLLRKDIIGKLSEQFIRICKGKSSQYHAGIITNGSLLTKRNLNDLINSRVTFAQVTIDGPREVHDKRRCLKGGGRTYDRIMANLSNIKGDNKFSVAIRVNIDKRNSDSISVLLADLKTLDLHKQGNLSVHFGHVFHASGSCPDISTDCMATPEFSEFLVKAYRCAISMGFKQSGYPTRLLSSCGAVGNGSAVIEPNGNVQNCWETVGDGNKMTGTVESDGIKYNENHFKWLGWHAFTEECKSCEVLPLCMRGCPHRTIYVNSAVGLSSCVSWKYNLVPMLRLMKIAKEQGLLAAGMTNSG